MGSPRYLIAKYAPDVRRMEPKNVGVVLWANGNVRARFQGDTDGTTVPQFVTRKNRRVYQEWIKYWKYHIQKPKLGRVDKNNPRFLNEIIRKSRDNYFMVDGGLLLTDVSPSEESLALNDLFDALVAQPAEEKPGKVQLKAACDSLFNQFLASLHVPDYAWECTVTATVRHTFKFDYAIAPNGTPRAVFQRVRAIREIDISSAAFKFRCAADSGLDRARCGALVSHSQNTSDGLDVLGAFGEVIDIDDQAAAASKIKAMAGIPSEP